MRPTSFIARFYFVRFCFVLLAAAFLSACKKEETPEAPLLTITAISPDTGPKNGFVTLTGTGFGTDPAANVVTLNDKPCVVTAASANYLTFTIPAKAGSGPIMVKANGQTAQSPPFTYIPQATVSTLAGSTEGFADGTGTTAQFNRPKGIAVAADGNLYVTQGRDGNNRIRKVTPAGVVSTVAGGTKGSADGLGTAAQFNNPEGIAVAADGTLYVADKGNHRIRKITPAGVVSTLAGGDRGNADGTGTAAQFAFPSGVAVGTDGTLYVANSHRIRKITPAGVVSTVAGSEPGSADGTGTAAGFNFPDGIAVGTDGSLYVIESGNDRIRKITPAGVVSTVAGGTKGSADGSGMAAGFNFPRGIAVGADGTLYVADTSNNRIRKVTPAGVVSTVAGSTQGFADGAGTAAQFNNPVDIAVGADGALYVTEYTNHRIRKIVQE